MRHAPLALLLLLPFGPLSAAPEIAAVTEPACNRETVVITGEGFLTGSTVVKALCLGAYDAKAPADPLALTVAPKPADARRTVNARDLGARGDGIADDTDALAEALRQAAPGGGILSSAGGRLPLEDAPLLPLANFANRFIENEVQGVTPFSGAQYGANWVWGNGWDAVMAGISVIPMDLGVRPGGATNGPARITANVFLNNWVSGARLGVGVSQRASGTLLQRTALYDVATPIVDRGHATRDLGTVLRADDTYTPERGPIR